MSQSPIYYASPNPYPPQRHRPTALTVLAIIGIVLGSLGVLCLGLSELSGIFLLINSKMVPALQQQPMDQRITNLIFGFCGLILSGVLLYASVCCLSLNRVSRRVMVAWAVVDIIFVSLRTLISVFVFLPRLAQNPAFHQMANGQQVIAIAKYGAIVGGAIGWLLPTAYDVLVLVFYRKPEIVAAFERPPELPNTIVPPPPM